MSLIDIEQHDRCQLEQGYGLGVGLGSGGGAGWGGDEVTFGADPYDFDMG